MLDLERDVSGPIRSLPRGLLILSTGPTACRAVAGQTRVWVGLTRHLGVPAALENSSYGNHSLGLEAVSGDPVVMVLSSRSFGSECTKYSELLYRE